MNQPQVPEALFDAPGSTSAIKWADHAGQLVLVWPRESIPDFPRNDGPGEVIRGDVVVLDPPNSGPIEYSNTLIFPKMMLGQVRNNIGKNRPNLGRIVQGVAKPNQSAPWILADPNENDQRMAVAFLTNPNAKPAEQVQAQPAQGYQQPQQAYQPQGAAQPPAQPAQTYGQGGTQTPGYGQPVQSAAPPF